MRFNKIEDKFPREIALLKGAPCSYGKCKFCTYTEDNDQDLVANYAYNKELLSEITGFNQTLEIINSGNVFDLDQDTLSLIRDIVIEKNIKVLYFECFLNHINKLDELREYFNMCELRFRLGLETFDEDFRKTLGKPFKYYGPLNEQIKQSYYSVCLMVGIKGQTKESILNDIKQGLNDFNQITVNVFIDNGSEIKADPELKAWFVKELAQDLMNNPRVELLIDNKDLGVFEQ